MRSFKRVKYARLDQDFGHVLVIALPEPSNLEVAGQLFCLSNLPLEVLRLHRQLGWLFYDGADGSCDINEFCLGSIEIDRQTFNLPSLSQERLFPPPTVDVAYRDLLGFPWVQTPTIYFRPQPPEESSADRGNEEFRKASERWCHADRAISTPEYFENQDGYDHKWDDITLYEPHPVRVWKGWHFELSSRFPQWSGDIANSVKITLSERARAVLEGASESVPCAWPDLESSDLFFSFSQMGHDKVIEREPPYRGVWLHRCGDWIVETVTNADEEVLNLGPGLAYVLQDSELTPQSVPDTCACGNTESHLRRVQSILRLPHFVFTGEITFVPHPAFIPAWYVAV